MNGEICQQRYCIHHSKILIKTEISDCYSLHFFASKNNSCRHFTVVKVPLPFAILCLNRIRDKHLDTNIVTYNYYETVAFIHIICVWIYRVSLFISIKWLVLNRKTTVYDEYIYIIILKIYQLSNQFTRCIIHAHIMVKCVIWNIWHMCS